MGAEQCKTYSVMDEEIASLQSKIDDLAKQNKILEKKLKDLIEEKNSIEANLVNFKKETDGKNFETVVDIGAGKSPYRKLIHCDKYIAVDVEDRRGAGDVVIADVNKDIPLENNITDLVLMTEVLEHIKEPRVVLAEVYRILKPAGNLF